jgi:predicted RND superfamily exporter protein
MQEALRRSILEKGVAISATSLILVIGFSVLLLSNFVPTMSFGGLSAVIMVTAWIGDMIVLPAAMLSIQGKNA